MISATVEAARRHLATHDPVLKDIIAQLQLPQIVSTQNLFHDLMSCVIEQQIHYRSSKKQFEKMLQKAEISQLTPVNFEAFEEKALSQVKLSARKYQTMAAVLSFFDQAEPDWQQMENVEVRKVLEVIPGVGRWTLDMLLIYTLGRPDVFPAEDYHLLQLMSQLYGLPPQGLKRAMRGKAEVWKPYCSYGFRYLLAWKEAEKKSRR